MIVILGLLAAIAAVSYRTVITNSQRAALTHTGQQFDKEARALAAFTQDAPSAHASDASKDLPSGWTVTVGTTDPRKVLLKRTSDGAWVCDYLAASYGTPGTVTGVGLPGDTSVTAPDSCTAPAGGQSTTGALSVGSTPIGSAAANGMPGNPFPAGTTVTASGAASGYPAANAIDRNVHNYWSSGATSGWLQITPPMPMSLSTVYISTGSNPAQTTHWSVDGFVNGTWQRLYDIDVQTVPGDSIYAFPVPSGTYYALKLSASGPSSWIPVTEVTTDGVTTASGSAYAATVGRSNPTAYWPLGDAAGGTASPNGVAPGIATNVGLVNSLVTGAPDGAASFTSSSKVSTSYNATNISSYSAEAWVKSTATGTVPFVADRGASPGPGKSITLAMGPVVGGCGAGRPFMGLAADSIFVGVCAPNAINDGSRHYVVGSWSGTSGQAITCSQFTLYVDGVKVGSPSCLSVNYTTPTVTPTAPISGAGGVQIGYDQVWGSFTGTLDEVAIYAGKTLADADVTSHWNAGR